MFMFSINFRIEKIGHRTKSNEGKKILIIFKQLKYKLEENIGYT